MGAKQTLWCDRCPTLLDLVAFEIEVRMRQILPRVDSHFETKKLVVCENCFDKLTPQLRIIPQNVAVAAEIRIPVVETPRGPRESESQVRRPGRPKGSKRNRTTGGKDLVKGQPDTKAKAQTPEHAAEESPGADGSVLRNHNGTFMRCPDCSEPFPNAILMGQHRTKEHFKGVSLVRPQLAGR